MAVGYGPPMLDGRIRAQWALAALLLWLGASHAVAAEPAPVQSARQHFDQGSVAFDLGNFREAAREYEEAYRLKPDPALLFNLGQAYRFAGMKVEALHAYRPRSSRKPMAPSRLATLATAASRSRWMPTKAAARAFTTPDRLSS